MKTLENGKRKYLKEPEIKSFQAALKEGEYPQDQLVFSLILFLGLRVQEAVNIKLDDINERDQTIIIRGLKSGRAREYDMPRKLWRRYSLFMKDRAVMATAKDNPFLFPSRLYKDSPVTAQAFKKAFKYYAEEAGLSPQFSIHSLRHSCAMIRVRNGSHPVSVMKWLRHRTVKSTEIYFEAFQDEKDNGIAVKQFEDYL